MGVSSDQAPSLLQQHSGSSNSGSSGEFPPPPHPTKMALQNHQESKKLKCPRCASTNTKFCYYNNYNKSQPRHFCKSCRRYWTEGGTLRNVPVGGGRKNKRLKPPPAATKAATKATNILATSHECMNRITQMETQAQNPKKGLISLGFGLEDEIGSRINGAIGGSSLSFPGDHELQFPSPISGYVSDLYSNGESCALEETAMAGVEPCLSLSSLNDQPWTYMESINSSWVWDDIDKFVSSDVSMPWDDAEMN